MTAYTRRTSISEPRRRPGAARFSEPEECMAACLVRFIICRVKAGRCPAWRETIPDGEAIGGGGRWPQWRRRYRTELSDAATACVAGREGGVGRDCYEDLSRQLIVRK